MIRYMGIHMRVMMYGRRASATAVYDDIDDDETPSLCDFQKRKIH
jgi:hypothetical protein